MVSASPYGQIGTPSALVWCSPMTFTRKGSIRYLAVSEISALVTPRPTTTGARPGPNQ